jgi:hypothetical protein
MHGDNSFTYLGRDCQLSPEPNVMANDIVDALEDQVRVLAQMDVGTMWDRVLGEFLGEWERLNRQQLPAAEMDRALQAFMDDLSDRPLMSLARQNAGVSYNQGRNVSILENAGEGKAFVVRSEILDNNTCLVCSLLDGEIFEVGSSEYFANMPPAQCLGGDNCGGFYIPIESE